ncbi:MAG TPA: YXWGXW repeat-containing protein [Polyangiaceae bacterium]
MRVPAVIACLAAACDSHTLAHPPYSSQPQSALVEVGAPLPPGRVEAVPPRPSAGAVWVDGEWLWRRERWAWRPGRWVDPPLDSTFSPAEFVRGADGRLWYAAGAWRDADGGTLESPAPIRSATVGVADVVNASGAIETTGATLRREPRSRDAAPD